MRRGGRVLLGAVGFAVMVVASAWAGWVSGQDRQKNGSDDNEPDDERDGDVQRVVLR